MLQLYKKRGNTVGAQTQTPIKYFLQNSGPIDTTTFQVETHQFSQKFLVYTATLKKDVGSPEAPRNVVE